MVSGVLLAYTGMVFALVIVPGANTMLTLRNTVSDGRKAGLVTILGGDVGILAQVLIVALGLSLAVVNSPDVYTLIKLAGSFYLIALGIRGLWRVHRRGLTARPALPTENRLRQGFWQGSFLYLLTPETMVFFLTVPPQFITPDQGLFEWVVICGLIYIAVRSAWMSVLVMFVGAARELLNRPQVAAASEILLGCVLIYFGLRFLTTL